MDDRDVMDVPPLLRYLDYFFNGPLGHAWIVLEKHSADVYILIDVAHNTDEAR